VDGVRVHDVHDVRSTADPDDGSLAAMMMAAVTRQSGYGEQSDQLIAVHCLCLHPSIVDHVRASQHDSPAFDWHSRVHG